VSHFLFIRILARSVVLDPSVAIGQVRFPVPVLRSWPSLATVPMWVAISAITEAQYAVSRI